MKTLFIFLLMSLISACTHRSPASAEKADENSPTPILDKQWGFDYRR